MKLNFEQVGLWSRTLGSNDHAYTKELERLRTSFFSVRGRVGHLLERIGTTLSNLTVHDLTHIDALWETADLVAGPNYPINPLEAYALGIAFLLHDSSLCFEAYEGGQAALRNSIQWKDSYSAEIDGDRSKSISQAEAEAAADFSALRLLHADQAPHLIERQWTDPDTNEAIFLIEDQELRKHLGPLIGEIAASHNWEIEDVASRLPNQSNAPGNWPPEWRIDSVKLACILRCADAAHIDGRRAPDFLHALVRRSGLSFEHWKAQNWLARADLDQSDPNGETIVFTSTRRFGPEDATAWWVAFDAIQLVQREITASNALLGSRSQYFSNLELRVKRVAGSASAETMSRYIRTSGWTPLSAELHVSNVENLVKSLGGENLYGRGSDHLGTVLRELIQNARDAIAARRALDNEYEGQIRIRVNRKGGEAHSVEIVDNGIGMSKRVMTGSLLDFGTSFWRTDLMKAEFPGLRSSAFKPIGKFGIGFYAVFMASNAVKISSRRWDRGLDTICSVHFPNGLTLRPLFREGLIEGFPSNASTRVTFELNSDYSSKVLTRKIPSTFFGMADIEAPLSDYLRAIVCGLDAQVELQLDDAEPIIIHERIEKVVSTLSKHTEWLSAITFGDYRDQSQRQLLERTAARLRPLKSGDKIIGFAALNNIQNARESLAGIKTIGGLATTVNLRNGNPFVGFLDGEPRSAKREGGDISASREVLEAWAIEQTELLKEEKVNPFEWLAITNSLASLEIDPTPIFRALFFTQDKPVLLDLRETFELMKRQPIAVFKSAAMQHIDTYVEQTSYKDYPTFRPTGNSSFLALDRNSDGTPKNPNSFIGCLHRFAGKRGYMLNYKTVPNVARGTFQRADVVLVSLAESANTDLRQAKDK